MNKYRNIKTTCPITGKKFDSKREYKRYKELQLLERAGEISDLKTQDVFMLIAGFKDNEGKTEGSVKYIADFTYYDKKLGKKVIEDVKSDITIKNPTYIIKRKLVKKGYPYIIFKEV